MVKKRKFEEIANMTNIHKEENKGILQTEEDLSEDTIVDQWTIDYRKENLDQDLNKIRDIALGKYECFLSFVENKNGQLSDRKINKFINDLINSHPRADTFSKEKRRLLELLFYCVICGPSGIKSGVLNPYFTLDYHIPDTFREFTMAAKDPIFTEKDRLKLVSAEEYDRCYIEYGSGFSFVQNLGLGSEVRSFYTPEELKEAAETYADIVGDDPDEVLDHWLGNIIPETVVDATKEEEAEIRQTEERNIVNIVIPHEEDDDTIELPAPNWEMLQADEEWHCRQTAEQIKKYEDHLPKNCHLRESYPELRRMLYVTDYSDISDLVEEMVAYFLINNELSPLCCKNGYSMISDSITKSVEAVEMAAKRIRNYR